MQPRKHEDTKKTQYFFFVFSCFRGCVLLFLMSFAVTPHAQQPPQPTFRTGQTLIVQTVTVKDKDGKAVEGLTAKDFSITEDGQPQVISFVEFQRLPVAQVDGTAQPAGSSPPEAPVAPQPFVATAGAAATVQQQISVPPPGDTRYRDRRLIVLYFDPSAISPLDQMRAYTNALKFVDTQMGPADVVAIITFQKGAVRVRQDFTSSRALLREVIQTLIFGDDADGDGIPDPLPGTAFGQDEGEFNIFNTDRQLSALQTAVTMLRPLPEQKSLIFFASGLRLNGTDNQAQLRATVNAAIRSNVTIHTIDARGLVATPPLGDATRPSPGWRRHVLRPVRRHDQHHLPAIPGFAVRAREGYRRPRDVRLQRPVARHRAGGRFDDQLLPDRLLQHAHGGGWPLPPGQGLSERRRVGRALVSAGVLRRQDVRQVHGRRQGASTRRCADAREPGHGHPDRDGSELFSVESRPVLHPRGREDPRERARARPSRRRPADAHRLHRRSQR